MQLRMTLQSDIYSGRRPIPGPNAIPHPQPSFRKPKLARLSRHIRTLASAEPETTKRSSRQATPTTPPAPGAPPPSAPPPPPEEDEKEHEKPHRYPLDVSRSWISIVTDKAVDAVDDIGVHLRRSMGPPPIKNDILSTRQKDGRMALSAAKPIVLVLGSGWAAHAVVKVIDTDKFCVACISPTNHFLFTPMLPGTAVGTIEFRSLLEPMRVANPFINYFEAACEKIDVQRKVASCTSAVADSSGKYPTFEIPYSRLVVAIGEKPATFNVKGVKENCFFMKEVKDTVGLRKRIQEVFEVAALPGTSEEQMAKLLAFVVVGGGPTGVEFVGTLSDFLRQDLKRKYPALMPYVTVTLLQSAQTILTQFDARLAQRAMDNFAKTGVTVRTGVRVVEVTEDEVVLKSGERLPSGVCVWSAGNAPRKLVQELAAAIPGQAKYTTPNKLCVDPFLRVIGARDVLALGDCSRVVTGPLPATAQVAAQQGAYVAHIINRGYALGLGGEDALPPWKSNESLSFADRVFATVTQSLDMTSSASMDASDETHGKAVALLKKPFAFLSLGILASIGNDQAIAQIEAFDSSVSVWGNPAFLLWKSVYVTKQVSFRNRALILLDWLKVRVFGRDLSQF